MHGYFPKSWSEGHIIPLHKKGNINCVENYRGITLLSCLGKLFTRLLNNRLSAWAEEYGIYVEAQTGFRTHLGTIDNIFVLHGLITHLINQGKMLYCAFIDFTKAFDYIVRDNLWYKLISLGVRGKILNLIKSMYSSVKSRVKHNGMLGEHFDCILGVRQGECLSPLLFSLFINDIEQEFIRNGVNGLDVNMIKLFMLLYADDIVLFAESAKDLQDGLDNLSVYCQTWKVKINPRKTKVVVFRNTNRNLTFTCNGDDIEIVNTFSYLGIVFTTGGSFSSAVNTLAGQAQKALFQLNKYLYKFTFITPKHKIELFDKLIVPVLSYGCEVWGFMNSKALESIHLRYLKGILGVKRTTQNDFIYGEFGRTSLLCIRYKRILKYWLKILESRDSKYIKIVYNLLIDDLILFPHKKSWVSLLRDLLASLDFYDAWVYQSVGDSKLFLSLVQQRITDQFIQNWESRLNDSTRAIFYNTFRKFVFQPYLDIINIDKFLKSFAKLRVSSHRLEVEAGRWSRPNITPFENRRCRICDRLEDEYHFILECVIYNDLRRQYIDSYYRNRPNMYKFVDLIKCENKRTIRRLGTYIFHAFELRNSKMLAS